jgi:acetyl-CoA carboxylase biotin carboxyl carrier protein
MNIKEIEEMIKLMNDNKLTELEIERNGLKIKLKKEGAQVKRVIEETHGAGSAQEAPERTEEEGTREESLIQIKSPMVGTFYGAPSPEADSFTEVGKIVKPEDVVCIIEAMKLMNEIKSEVKGRVVEISVENGSPVEYGQVLFKLEPLT